MNASQRCETVRDISSRGNLELEQDGISVEEDAHTLYMSICQWVRPVFFDVSDEDVNSLAKAGYLYFRFLLVFDDLLDAGADSGYMHRSLQTGLALHEASIRKLSHLFGQSSPFWPQFQVLKTQYQEAIAREVELKRTQRPYTHSDFEFIAAGKSAMSLAAPLGMSVLASRTNCDRKDLDKMLVAYHRGIQILDDIDDFKIDLQTGQRTYAIQCVRSHLKERGVSSVDNNKLYKYLFISGVAVELLDDAIGYFDEARRVSNAFGLDELSARISEKVKRSKRHKREINALILKTAAKASLSATPLFSDSGRSLAVDRSIAYATEFLAETHDQQGGWSDFMTSAGEGRSWIDAYVYQSMHSIPMDALEWCTSDLRSILLSRKCNYLSAEDRDERRGESGRNGAYNSTMMQDGDSLTFNVAARLSCGVRVPSSMQDDWVLHRRVDGGWSTYVDADRLRRRLDIDAGHDVGGWLQPHACVTASASYVLARWGETLSAGLNLSMRWLLEQQHDSGTWLSYWWTSPIYATTFSIRALVWSLLKHVPATTSSECDVQKCQNAIEQAVTWLLDQQQECGVWVDATQSVSPFYTALAVVALRDVYTCTADTSLQMAGVRGEQVEAAMVQGSQWLCRQQRDDGSWWTHRILQIPEPSVYDPTRVKRWRHSSFGTNIRVDDHRRVFTTATVVTALSLMYQDGLL